MFLKEIISPLNQIIKNKPHLNAFYIGGCFYSYAEFGASLSKIRNAIRKEQPANKHIGLVANDDLETYASLFAIWLEGCAFIPLNPAHPAERKLEIIEQAELSVILNSSSVIKPDNCKTIHTKSLTIDNQDLGPKSAPDSRLAYILFTSGSTGKPKGVTITRSNIAFFMHTYWKNGYQMDHNDRCLQSFDLSFDLSIMSYLPALIKGACVYTIPPGQIKYATIVEMLEKQAITTAIMVPSTIRYLEPYFNEIELPHLRLNQFCGEGLEIKRIEKWSRCVPNAVIENIYGPTENTIVCSSYRYKRNGKNKTHNGILSIGKAMNKGQIVIMNEQGQELAEGETGELCVQGDQLFPGYWNLTEKNQEVFFTDREGRRLYKTGDLGFKDKDGDFMYCGRMDAQIKVQGFRVEPGEIEFHARNYLSSKSAVALGFQNQVGNTEIALFIEEKQIHEEDLLAYLRHKLPSYMIPTKIICRAQFPLNANGKTDRNALRKTIIF